MSKASALVLAVAIAVMASGCAVVGRHTETVDNGTRTTVGLISFNAIGDGYPMIPCYTSFAQGK